MINFDIFTSINLNLKMNNSTRLVLKNGRIKKNTKTNSYSDGCTVEQGRKIGFVKRNNNAL